MEVLGRRKRAPAYYNTGSWCSCSYLVFAVLNNLTALRQSNSDGGVLMRRWVATMVTSEYVIVRGVGCIYARYAVCAILGLCISIYVLLFVNAVCITI